MTATPGPTATTSSLPSGTVTFVFTDIEGSTRLLQAIGPKYGELLEEHRRLVREAATAQGGVDFGSEGDALFLVGRGAAAAAAAAEKRSPDAGGAGTPSANSRAAATR